MHGTCQAGLLTVLAASQGQAGFQALVSISTLAKHRSHTGACAKETEQPHRYFVYAKEPPRI